MEEILVALVIGIGLGMSGVLNSTAKGYLTKAGTVSIAVMLFCLGAKIGCDPVLLAKLGTLGQQSLFLGISTMVGSVIMVYLLTRALPHIATKLAEEEEKND